MDFASLTDAALLDKLDAERLPMWHPRESIRQADPVLMGAMIDELTRRGVYPDRTVEANPNDVRAMVDGWGARWFEWTGHLSCVHCKIDLRDHRLGPPFKLEVGISRQDHHHYECPKCRGILPR